MKTHTHFPNLDGLRFVAALAVVVGHIAQISSIFGLPSLWHFRPVMLLGDTAVSVFFVLSGFLITYLLLQESERTGTIDFFGFYRRRALRILPVYVAVCVLSFFVIPYFSLMDVPGYAPPWTAAFWKSAALYAVLSPHVAAPIYPGVPYAGVLWSVGVEEWFYFLCPAILFLAGKRSAVVAVAVILLLIPCRLAPGWLSYFFSMLRFDCLAVGGLFAMLLIYAPGSERLASLQRLLTLPETQVVALCAAPLTLFLMDHATQAIIFGIVIFNLATNPNSILRLDHPAIERLGALSYAMYGYNWMTTVISVQIAIGLFGKGLGGSIATFIIGIILIFAAATISYFGMEKPFLRMKGKKSDLAASA
jgi:peptidoglycan/LPS O-acetylase OafA/YrhL